MSLTESVETWASVVVLKCGDGSYSASNIYALVGDHIPSGCDYHRGCLVVQDITEMVVARCRDCTKDHVPKKGWEGRCDQCKFKEDIRRDREYREQRTREREEARRLEREQA